MLSHHKGEADSSIHKEEHNTMKVICLVERFGGGILSMHKI